METFFPSVETWLRVNLAAFGLRLLAATVVLIIGVALAGVAGRAIGAAIGRTPLARKALLVRFLSRTARVVVLVFAGVVALGELGVDIGPLIAGIGIGGFVVGFAFKDSLSNLAAGLLLLFYEPFDLGDAVEVDGTRGRVLDMSIAATELRMEDGHLAIIPNSRIWNARIVNFSRLE